jgi:hypothetical protein
MSAEDMVDAALVGLDLGEFVTLLSLPDMADWEAYERARRALMPNLSHAPLAAWVKKPSCRCGRADHGTGIASAAVR